MEERFTKTPAKFLEIEVKKGTWERINSELIHERGDE